MECHVRCNINAQHIHLSYRCVQMKCCFKAVAESLGYEEMKEEQLKVLLQVLTSLILNYGHPASWYQCRK